MPNTPNNSPVRLYIGFGGSGLKTLSSFVNTLAQHGEWGDEAETHCAFILADTDRGDIAAYSKRIREAAGKIGRDPIVRTIQTSEGAANFSEYAADRLGSARHHERVKDHWWYRQGADNRPFTAERFVGNPGEGAGQCPAISTFLAWNILDQMGREVQEVVEQLKGRLTLRDDKQDWTLHTTIIAGLAGGTGRGCWHLLASKVREVLAQVGRQTSPAGYFYDASVFADVMNRDPAQALKMRVNALTGFSELTGWMRNETDNKPYQFRLPNLESPHDRGSDVIDVTRVNRGLPGVRGEAPVNQAYVIFGVGRAGRPGTPEAYYKVVANAMYSRLVREVAGGIVNQPGFGGIGAASIEIPINKIRDYVKRYVGIHLPRTIAAEVESPTVERWVKVLTDGLKSPHPFTYAPKSDGTIVERVLSGVMASVQPRLRRLAECMDPKTKDYKRAGEECRRLDGWADSKDGAAAISTIASQTLIALMWGAQSGPDVVGTGGLMRDLGALDKLSPVDFALIFGGGDGKVKKVNPLSEALRRIVMRPNLRLSKPDGTTDQLDLRGFGTKAALARKLVTVLQEIAKQVPGVPTGADQHAVGAQLSHDVFVKATKGFFSGGIDANEAGMISEAASSRVRIRSMGSVGQTLRREFNVAADELNQLAKELESVVTLLRGFAEDAERDLKPIREQLFWTAEDFGRMMRQAADAAFDGKMLTDQVLEPVANDAVLEKALTSAMESADNQRFESALVDFVRLLDGWIRESSATADAAERQRELRRLASRGLESLGSELVLGRKFYSDNFGFFSTVRALLTAWGAEFARRAASEEDTKRLQTAFRVQFGRDYPFDRDGPVRLTGDELNKETLDTCAAMAVSLGNRCDALVEIRGARAAVESYDVVEVVAPAEVHFTQGFKTTTERLATERGLARAGTFSVHPTYEAKALGNPFLMTAYAQESFPVTDEGLDRIASLHYHKDPNIARWLQACEDPSGQSFFEVNDEVLPLASRVFGLGYTTRALVVDEALRRHRWKPWTKSGAAAHDARQNFALDALAFALLDEPRSELGAALQRVHDSMHWSIPIIGLRHSGQGEAQGKKWEFARSAFRDDFGIWSANNPAFRAGDGYTSIKKLLAAMEGDENPIIDAVAKEAVHYLGAVLPAHAEEVSADAALVAMFRDLRARLTAARDAETGPTRDEFVRLYDRLIERIGVLAGMSCSELRGHFERRGRH
jgi:hypothetical protein